MAEMKSGFDHGAKRRANPGYAALERRVLRLRRKIDALRAVRADEAEIRACMKRIKAIDRERRKVPSVDPMDPNFRRLRYCRYADDFLIGIIGSKADAREMMTTVQNFLSERLNLAVSPEKSGIKIASKGAPFSATTYVPSRSAPPDQWPGATGRTADRCASGAVPHVEISNCGCRANGVYRVLQAQTIRQSRHEGWPIASAVPGLQ